jgi:hypothetical protein
MSKNFEFNKSLKQEAMLKALRELSCNVCKAAERIHITPQTHYNWYKSDEEYRDKVDYIKYEIYEGYKDLVFEAVVKKVREGNATVITRVFYTLFSKWAEQMERANPYRPRLMPKIRYIDKPGDASL